MLYIVLCILDDEFVAGWSESFNYFPENRSEQSSYSDGGDSIVDSFRFMDANIGKRSWMAL